MGSATAVDGVWAKITGSVVDSSRARAQRVSACTECKSSANDVAFLELMVFASCRLSIDGPFAF